MKNITNLSHEELVKFVKTWQEGKETRSIVVVAIDRDDNEGAADVSNMVSGNARDIVLTLARLINENQDIFKPAIKLAEIAEAKEKKGKG